MGTIMDNLTDYFSSLLLGQLLHPGTRFDLGSENGQADMGRYGRTCLARSNSEAGKRAAK